MTIKVLPRYLMNIAEMITVAWQLILLLRDFKFADTHQLELVQVLEQDTKKAEDAFGAEDTTSDSGKKRDADALRDETCTQMAGYFRGLQCHHKVQTREAAVYLYDLMSRHDFGGRKQSYAEQTAVLRAMISDMKSEQAQNAFTTTDAIPLFEQLCEHQAAFESIVMEKINLAIETNEPSVNSLIEPVRTGIAELLNHLSSRERLHADQYASLVVKANEIISDIANKVHVRKKSKKPVTDTLVVESTAS